MNKIMPELQVLQRRAQDAFAKQGLPARNSEDWRYTPLAGFWNEEPQKISVAKKTTSKQAQQLHAQNPCAITHTTKGFTWTQAARKAEGLELRSLADAMAQDELLAARVLRQARADIGAAMAGQNLGAFADGLFVKITQTLAEPLLLHWQSGGAARLWLEIAPEASAELIELDEAQARANLVQDWRLARASHLAHFKIADPQASTLTLVRAELLGKARLRQHIILADGRARLVRHETVLALRGSGAAGELSGCAVHGRDSTRALMLESHHRAPATKVQMRTRHVIAENARGVFHGHIHITKRARHTDAQQNTKSLLLSPLAEMDARPELRIFADDVACAHGVSIGELDEAALFYLQSRGLTHPDARALLLAAFAHEALEGLAPSHKSVAATLLTKSLRRVEQRR